jgi:ubiquinone/menaquinone biosynthesis C-methylase UbiE
MLRHLDDLRALLATIARVLDEEGVPTRVWERLVDELPFAREAA